MRWIIGWALAATIAGNADAQVGKSQSAPMPVMVVALPADATPRPVALTRIGSEFRPSQLVGAYRTGPACLVPADLLWTDVEKGFLDLKRIFSEELSAAGFKSDADPGSLFSDVERRTSDLELRAMFKSIDANFCQELRKVTGTFTLEVQWQLYSHLKRDVLMTAVTKEQFQRADPLGPGKKPRNLHQEVFAANVRALLNNDAFRRVALDVSTADNSSLGVTQGQLAINFSSKPTPISDAVGSVVAIFSGGGFGSGALVSADGHILTNHHVVGDAKTVRVRWSDGLEATGEVLRSDKRRDVALVKVAPRSRTPLAINRTPPPVGASVFAIGTPLDPKMQNTVTRGIHSATRIMDGFSFIQSDVAVSPGNSGGPLLDEKGTIIGLTVLGYRPDGTPTGLNFFVPIGDALDFLQLTPAP
jgi:S1-C subfamily serine protease